MSVALTFVCAGVAIGFAAVLAFSLCRAAAKEPVPESTPSDAEGRRPPIPEPRGPLVGIYPDAFCTDGLERLWALPSVEPERTIR